MAIEEITPHDKVTLCACINLSLHNTTGCNNKAQHKKWLRELAATPAADSRILRSGLIIAMLLTGEHRIYYKPRDLSLEYPELCDALESEAIFFAYIEDFATKFEMGKNVAPIFGVGGVFGEARLIVDIGHRLLDDRIHSKWFRTPQTLDTRLAIMRAQFRISTVLNDPAQRAYPTALKAAAKPSKQDPEAQMDIALEIAVESREQDPKTPVYTASETTAKPRKQDLKIPFDISPEGSSKSRKQDSKTKFPEKCITRLKG